jgi:hypothetical protein
MVERLGMEFIINMQVVTFVFNTIIFYFLTFSLSCPIFKRECTYLFFPYKIDTPTLQEVQLTF